MPAPEQGQAWGVLGGLFDPVHLGHLKLAEEISAARALDGVLFVLSYRPPHRNEQPQASFDHRAAMLRLALADRPRFQFSDIERGRDRPGYTLEIVRRLKRENPGVALHFIVGADNLSQLRSWYHWEELLDEIPILVGSRPLAEQTPVDEAILSKVIVIPTTLIDISSTQIRRAVKQGFTVDDLSRLVPRPVALYIAENRLYL